MRRVLVALALLLTACSDGASNPSASSSGTPSATPSGTIRVQAAGGEGELNALRELIKAFEAAHPGAKVEFTGLAEQGEHISKLGTAFAGGNPPDVFLLNYRRFGRFAAQGVIDPAKLPGTPSDYFDQALEAFTLNGTLLCAPQNLSSSVLYYNKKLLQDAGVEVPTTTAELDTVIAGLNAKKIKTIGFEYGMRTVAPFVWNFGGDVVDNLNKPTVITLGSPQAREALTYLKKLVDKGGVNATDFAASPPEDRFAQGELAMFIDSRRAVPALRKAESLDFDVAKLPKHNQDATLLASDAYCVAKAAKNPPLAHAFAQYAVSNAGGTVLAESGRTVPSLKVLAESDAFLASDKKPASSQVWLDVADFVRRLPNVAQWNEAETTASDALEQYFAGKASLDATVKLIEKESKRILAAEG